MKKFVLLAIALICFCQPAFSDDGVMTWEECVKEARQSHPDLLSAKEKVNAAKASKGETRSGMLPQVSGSAAGTASKTEGRDRAEAYSYGVSGRQLLFDGFKAANDLAAADENIKSAAYAYLVASSDLRYSLRAAFVGLLSAQESLTVTEGILKRRKQNLELVHLQYQGGREHKGALLTAEANVAEAEYDYTEARRNVELYQRRLSKTLGRSAFTPLNASGDLAVKPTDPVRPDFEKLIEGTPLLKELVAKKEAARFGLKSARSDFFPQIYADVGAHKTGTKWAPETSDWSAGISVTIPLFEGGQKQAALSKARANYNQLQADERSGRDGAILTMAESWTEWQNKVDQTAVQVKFLQASQQRADIAEAQYTSGLVSFNDWTDIEDNLVRDQKALLQVKLNALVAEAAWYQAKGVTLDE